MISGGGNIGAVYPYILHGFNFKESPSPILDATQGRAQPTWLSNPQQGKEDMDASFSHPRKSLVYPAIYSAARERRD